MADGDRALALGELVLGRADPHRLRLVPVARIEAQHHGAVGGIAVGAVDRHGAVVAVCTDIAAGQQRIDIAQVGGYAGRGRLGDLDRVALARRVFLVLGRTRRRDRHIDHHTRGRRDGQLHGVGVGIVGSIALAHRRAVGLADDHDALLVGRDIDLHARGQQLVISAVGCRSHQVVDHAAAALQLAAGDRLGDVATDAEAVAAQAANQARGHAERRAQHEEVVVAFEAVDLDHLDVGKPHRQAGTKDAVLGDDDVVSEFGAQHDHLVEAAAAVDRHRCIDVVLNLIVALSRTDGGGGVGGEAAAKLGNRHAAGIALDHAVDGDRQCKGAHDELVIAGIAFQTEFRLVRIDRELVVAIAALGDQWHVVARAQIAARGADGGEFVTDHQATDRLVALGAEDLADLEVVVTLAAVQRGDCSVVVDHEVVVAALAIDGHAPVQVDVVVDALDFGRAVVARVTGRHARLRDVTVQQRDHARRLVGFTGNVGHATQQEQVVRCIAGRIGAAVAAEDRQRVDAVVLGAAIEHIDQVVAGIATTAECVDLDRVGAGLAVDHQRVLCRARHQVAACGVEHGRRRPGGDIGILQEKHADAVLAIGHQRLGIGTAVHTHLRTDEDEARIAPIRAAGTAAGVTDIDEVGVGVAPNLGHRDRRGDARRIGADRRIAGNPRRRHHGTGHQLATQHHVRAVIGVGIAVVATNVDRPCGHDFAVRVEHNVVAYPQCDRAARKDAAMGDVGFGALEHQLLAAGQQEQVFAMRRGQVRPVEREGRNDDRVGRGQAHVANL